MLECYRETQSGAPTDAPSTPSALGYAASARGVAVCFFFSSFFFSPRCLMYSYERMNTQAGGVVADGAVIVLEKYRAAHETRTRRNGSGGKTK